MMEQLALAEIYSDERRAFDLLYPEIQDIILGAPMTSNILIFEELTDGSSIYFLNKGELFFRIRMRKKNWYIQISDSILDVLPDKTPVSRVKSAPGMIRIKITSCEDILLYVQALRMHLEQLCSKCRTIGCCSRYELCSDARSCVHTDPEVAIKCWYRSNLQAGRVFYGKNKNIP